MPTPPGFADCSLKFVLDGFIRPAFITFGVDPSATNPDTVATSVYNAATGAGSIATQLDSTVMITDAIARLGTDGGEDLVGQHTGTTRGGRTGGAPPPNVAVLVHKRTARGGRRGRGRLYLPWWCSDNDTNEDGTLLTSFTTPMLAALNVWLAAMVSASIPMVLLHGPGRTIEGPPDVVTSLSVSNVVGTQRRRLGR
jgi:hypothetical protein